MASFYSTDGAEGGGGVSALDNSNDENSSFNSINLLSPVSAISGHSPVYNANNSFSATAETSASKSLSPMISRHLSLSAFKLSRVANTNIVFSDRSNDNSPLMCNQLLSSPGGSINSDVVAVCVDPSYENNKGQYVIATKKRKSDDSSDSNIDSFHSEDRCDNYDSCELQDVDNNVLGSLPSSSGCSSDTMVDDVDGNSSSNINDCDNDNNSNNDNNSSESQETDEERIEREALESERLAWELMRQDGIDMYQMQVNFMRDNATDMSEDDIRAIEQAVRENAQYDFTVINHHLAGPANNNDDNGGHNEEDNGEEEVVSDNEVDGQGLDYEQLLALGNQLGDVKTEMWQKKAKRFIEKLPQMTIAEIRLERGELEPRCVICMDDWTEDGVDEGSVSAKILQCSHYFHCECTEGWLRDHYQCPICKCKVTGTP